MRQNCESTLPLLFADDQIVIQSNEDDLQRSTYLLDKINLDYNMQILIFKTKSVALKGKEPGRTDLVIDEKSIE